MEMGQKKREEGMRVGKFLFFWGLFTSFADSAILFSNFYFATIKKFFRHASELVIELIELILQQLRSSLDMPLNWW